MDCYHPLRENGNSPSAPGFRECQISGTRGTNSSPSVALGEEILSRVPNSPWHLGKRGTRGRPPSPSATLGEEMHPRTKMMLENGDIFKTLFPECLSLALGEANLFPECLTLALGEASLFPECLILALGEGSLPRVLG
jgi:hypothetical protein